MRLRLQGGWDAELDEDPAKHLGSLVGHWLVSLDVSGDAGAGSRGQRHKRH